MPFQMLRKRRQHSVWPAPLVHRRSQVSVKPFDRHPHRSHRPLRLIRRSPRLGPQMLHDRLDVPPRLRSFPLGRRFIPRHRFQPPPLLHQRLARLLLIRGW